MSAPGGRYWHITLRVSGQHRAWDLDWPLRRLCAMDPANMAARYDTDRLELQFWDEGPDLESVARAALRLWERSRGWGGLPDWSPVALEVHQQEAWRGARGRPTVPMAPGTVAPMG